MLIVRRLLLFIALIIVLSLIVLWIGASLSLDRDRLHSASVDALPIFDGGTDGLVVMQVGESRFRARVGGFAEPVGNRGNLVLLHGFPETSIMYEPLVSAAAQAGYRVIAFDQRGYSPGARPEGRSSYVVPELVGDVIAVADAAGFDTFHLVGHDWGAAVGWATVLSNPERVDSWSALSIPHVAAFGEAVQNDPEQRSKSSYMMFFWQPWLPEQVFAFNDFALLRSVMYSEHPAEYLAEYLSVFAEPGALTGALNWYRAGSDTGPPDGAGSAQVATPTLFIWGNQDVAVGRTAVAAQRKYMDGPFVEMELDTGHWLMETAADKVVPAVLAHIDSVQR